MPWEAAAALPVSADDRELLSALARGGRTPQRVALRARIVLGAAAGRVNHALAQELGVSRLTVLLWRERYANAGLPGLLKDAPRPGRWTQISPQKVQTIVEATLHATPRDATHWSVRTLAKAKGVSPAAVRRIWREHHLQPHRSERFKLSTDPDFVRKVRDIVGLYLSPPDKALVLCVDEKSQIQALDRTQLVLPLRPVILERQTHDIDPPRTRRELPPGSPCDGEQYVRGDRSGTVLVFSSLPEITAAAPPEANVGLRPVPAASARPRREPPELLGRGSLQMLNHRQAPATRDRHS